MNRNQFIAKHKLTKVDPATLSIGALVYRIGFDGTKLVLLSYHLHGMEDGFPLIGVRPTGENDLYEGQLFSK